MCALGVVVFKADHKKLLKMYSPIFYILVLRLSMLF
jgi:hypothetical protein